MATDLSQEIIILLKNRKQLFSERLGAARQRGDFSELATIEAELLEIARLLDVLEK